MKRRLWVLVALAVVAGFGVEQGAAQDDDTPVASLRFVVVRDYSGKPVKNAAVVLHPVSKGKQSRGGIELKTNTEGRTAFEGVPYGPLRVQVLMPGFQTFGEDYEINKPDMEITVRLKRPQGQYSIYENHPEEKKPEEKKDEKKDENKPPEQKPEQKPQ
jgi:hypothetical protein